MSDTVNHQADPPGVTWDLTIDGHRYLVIENGPASDCGYPGSRDYSYGTLRCRCDACRIARAEAVRRRRQARSDRTEAQRHADTHGGARIEVAL